VISLSRFSQHFEANAESISKLVDIHSFP